jgi:hypothetical protein
MEKWTERFQCLRSTPEDVDPVVQVFFKRSIQGHALEGLEEHKIKLSKLPYLKELLNPERVEELEKEQSIPAADRIVSRSDNSEAYDEAAEAIERAEKALRETNQHIEGKGEAIEELSFVRKLMKRGYVKLMVIGTLAVPALIRIRDNAIDVAIKMPIEYALTKIAALIGWAFKMFIGSN